MNMQPNETAERIPPHSIEAEQAVLGSVLLEPKAILAVLPVLEPKHFYRADHQRIFMAFLRLHSEQKAIDVLTVKAALRDLDAHDIAGNVDLFTTLGAAVPSVSNCEHYAKIVRQHWLLRETIATCNDLLVDAFDAKHDPSEMLARAQTRILGVSRSARTSEPSTLKDLIGKIVGNAVNEVESSPGISTGLEDADRLLAGGPRQGEFLVIGGRPSSGKSASAANIIPRFALAELGTLVFSLEVPKDQLTRNILSCSADISTMALRTGKLTPDEWRNMRGAAEHLFCEHVQVDDEPRLTPSILRAKCQWFSLKRPLSVVIVDHLHLMDSDRRGRRMDELAEISRSLKLIARELNVAMIVLAQLSRASEKEECAPRMSDLRECGSIEQDADVVMLLHNKSQNDADPADVDFIIAKQRNGPCATLPYVFHKKCLRFEPKARWNATQVGREDESGPELF